MGRRFFENFGGTVYYCCDGCGVFLTNKNQIVSTHFTGLTGPAILFKTVVNIRKGKCVQRDMYTGLHYVRDVFCLNCEKQIGWIYELAINESERYKEGSVTLEKKLIRKVESDFDDEPPRPVRNDDDSTEDRSTSTVDTGTSTITQQRNDASYLVQQFQQHLDNLSVRRSNESPSDRVAAARRQRARRPISDDFFHSSLVGIGERLIPQLRNTPPYSTTNMPTSFADAYEEAFRHLQSPNFTHANQRQNSSFRSDTYRRDRVEARAEARAERERERERERQRDIELAANQVFQDEIDEEW